MADECSALLTAIDRWKICPNQDDRGRAVADAWRDAEKLGLDADGHVTLDADSQHAIAIACHRATASVKAATVRCENGKPPRTD